MLAGFADGVWLCELADLRDAEAVPEAVAAALGYAPSQGMLLSAGLAVFFRNKQLLLILDNCEHLLRGVADFVIDSDTGCARAVGAGDEPRGTRHPWRVRVPVGLARRAGARDR